MPPGPVALTLEHLASIEPESDVVLIVENLQTGFSLSLPETVPVIMSHGQQLEPPADIPWLAKKRILYAGNLDTHGYAML